MNTHHVLLDGAQGVEALALSVAVEARVANGNLLSKVLDQSLKVNQVLNIWDKEAVSHCHVADIRFKGLAEVSAEQTLLRSQLPRVGDLLFNQLLLCELHALKNERKGEN